MPLGTPVREHVAKPPGSGVRLAFGRQWKHGMDWHHHAEWELAHVVCGTGQRLVGDSAEPYASGDLVLLPPWLPHAWASATSPATHEALGGWADAGRVPVQVATVAQWDDPWWQGLCRLVPELARAAHLLAGASRGLLFSADAGVGASLTHAAGGDELGKVTALVGALDTLADVPERHVRPLAGAGYVEAATPPAADERLARVLAVAHDRHRAGRPALTQREAASRASLSPEAFARLFRRALGCTYVGYLHGLQVGAAARLLAETDTPVTTVAGQSGFANLSHFNRVFRRLRGCTPREFRRRVREAVA